MRKICLIILCFCAVYVTAQNQINGYTYWFNDDFETRITQIIVPQQQAVLELDIETSSLLQGLNVFNFQAFDNNDVYSSPISKFFYKTKGAVSDTNRIAAYRYWFNSDLVNIDTVFITPEKNADIMAEVDANSIADGLNSISFQVMDEQEIWSSVVSKFFLKANTHYINAYQYWFNNEIASAVLVDVFPSQVVMINDSIDASELNEGINIIHIRFRDEQNLWSSTISQFFFKAAGSDSDTSKICAYQYWFNNDIASAVTVNIDPAQVALINGSIEASALNDGINIIHFRLKDERNLWSSTISQFFYKTQGSASDTAKICAYQYWFDNDFSNAVTNEITPLPQATITASVPAELLTDGLHSFNVRFKQESGVWSSVINSYFFKYPVSNSPINLISEYQYWFNTDYENAVHYILSEPVPQHDLIMSVDMTQMPKGEYLFNLRTKDTLGLWSSVITDPFTKLPYPISSFEANMTEFCDSGYVQFTDHSIDGDVYLWDFSDGEYSYEVEPLHFFAAPGEYIVSLTVTDILTALDSTTWLTINVHSSYNFQETHDICFGDIYNWHGNDYNETGIYYDSLFTVFGCDSVFVLNLTVNPVYEFIEDYGICSGETYTWRENEYSVEGIYYDSLLTVNSCDSVYVLNLIVYPVYEFSEDVTICEGEAYTWRGNDYSVGGIYYDSLQTEYSCDSVFVLNLTVNPVYEFIEDYGICSGETYTWRENEYSVEGLYYDSLLTVNSCDSVYVLNLIVYPVYEFSEDVTICEGEAYTWRGNDYSVGGIYYDSLQTEYSCDSVFVLNLTVNPIYEFVEDYGICSGETYTWRENEYSVEGIYYDSLLTVNSCDSVYVLNLSVYPVYEFEEDIAICQGEIYTWRGDEYTEEGTYYDNLQTVNSCDSIYILNLIIKEVFNETVNAEICAGETYILGSQTIDEEGEYTETFVAINGCDSVVTLNLSVFAVNVSITYEDNILSANNTNGTYQWVDCENYYAQIEGETDRIFIPQANGNYAVIITEGLCTDTSECQLCSGINTFVTDNVKVYPNPTNSELFVEISENADAQIIDALGRVVSDFNLFEGLNAVDISDFADGVYYLKINYYNQKQNIVKLIKFSD
ncbi:MAG: T9SS type A sorting domain-containing protein [Bacteroidales bacterium]|nr:T9SS type A sorting domain-containing protein [Bacteroidales bacterium]